MLFQNIFYPLLLHNQKKIAFKMSQKYILIGLINEIWRKEKKKKESSNNVGGYWVHAVAFRKDAPSCPKCIQALHFKTFREKNHLH